MSDDINKQIILAMKRSVEDAAKPANTKPETKPRAKRVRELKEPTVSDVLQTEETQETQE